MSKTRTTLAARRYTKRRLVSKGCEGMLSHVLSDFTTISTWQKKDHWRRLVEVSSSCCSYYLERYPGLATHLYAVCGLGREEMVMILYYTFSRPRIIFVTATCY